MVSGWLRTHNLWKSESCKKHTNFWPQSRLAFWFKCLWYMPTPVMQVCQFSSVLDSWPFLPILTGSRTFQPRIFNPRLFNHETLNPRVEGLFNLRLFYHACFNIIEVWCWSFIVENAGGWKVRVESLGLKSSGVEMSWHLLTVPSPAWKISKLLNLDSWKWWLTCLYLSQGSTAKSIYSSMFIVCLYLQCIIYYF